MSAMSDALNRLLTGYYNSAPVDATTNPGGLDNDGHEVNFPAAMADLGLVTQYLSLFDAAGISGQASALAPNFRNMLINGALALDQRNGMAAVAVAAATSRKYVCDRFAVTTPTTGALTAQVVGIDWSAIGVYAKNALKLTVTTAQAAVAAGDLSWLSQRIEGIRIPRLKWGSANARPVMASMGLQMPVTGVYGVSLVNAAGNRSLVQMVNLVANTPTAVSFGIAGETGGVWATDTSLGIDVRINLMCGANGQAAAAGVWNASDKQALNAQANFFATNGNIGYVTELQLEAGNVKSPFESRPDDVELRMAQRYFETAFTPTVAPTNGLLSTYIPFVAYDTSDLAAWVPFTTVKRGSPTILLFGSANLAGSLWAYYNGGWTAPTSQSVPTATPKGFDLVLAKSSAFAAGAGFIVSGGWSADCEL